MKRHLAAQAACRAIDIEAKPDSPPISAAFDVAGGALHAGEEASRRRFTHDLPERVGEIFQCQASRTVELLGFIKSTRYLDGRIAIMKFDFPCHIVDK